MMDRANVLSREAAEEAIAPTKGASRRSTVRRLLRRPMAVIGILILTVLTLGSIFAPVVTPYDYRGMNPRAALQPPSAQHIFGTDHFGRDQLTRLLYGGRVSLQVGFIAMSIGVFFGVLLGSIAGYVGGWIDELISRVIDVMLAFPGILLALAIIAILGPSLTNLMIAIGISSIPSFTRLTRGVFLAARELDYVVAARALGASGFGIVFRHMMPNIVAPIMVFGTLAVAGAILSSAALNFLGLGASPPTPDWGLMLSESRDYMRRAWWLATMPGLTIVVTVIAINLVGDALRDVLDPWMRT